MNDISLRWKMHVKHTLLVTQKHLVQSLFLVVYNNNEHIL